MKHFHLQTHTETYEPILPPINLENILFFLLHCGGNALHDQVTAHVLPFWSVAEEIHTFLMHSFV